MTALTDTNLLPLVVTIGERLDLELDWELASSGAEMPMTGFTAVMNIYATDGSPRFTSSGDTPDIGLTQNTAHGKITLTLDTDLVAKLLVPYRQPQAWTYTIDLVDDADDANKIPFVHGGITVQKPRTS